MALACAALIAMVAGVVPAHAAAGGAASGGAPKKNAAPAAAAGKSRKGAPRDTSRVLVRVGNEPITVSMVQTRIDELPEQYRAQYATPGGRQHVIDRMIEEKVWLTTALRNGVADRPRIQQQLEQQRRDLLIRTWINEQMATSPAPSDSEARVFYDSHPADYRSPATATLRHIQFKTDAEARRVLPFARDPKQDFGKLAERYSADTLTKKTGGTLGTVTPDGVFPTLGTQKALAESVFTLREGGVGGPWKSDRGWHLIKVDQKREASPRAFEQARPMIVRQLSGQRSQEFYRKMLEDARRKVGITPDSAAIRSFVSARRPAREMFKDAQDASGPQARIEGYRRVVEAWPQSDVAPQAQFMIGFIQSEELKNYDEADQAFRTLLQKYPQSELAASATWMIEHMRTEEAPAFITQQADSSQAAPSPAARNSAGSRKPASSGKP
ncbi:MAG: peptidyl-prolyl cis-trans isomerase [Candidatus Eisenbacteria bacterium]|nr:peptidyl-prolyl cis-trans isomerase [Candidatus Eisenbacteria bacterium]